MSNQNLWRFPSNNFDVEKGLDTADMETFKKDPISSLAREICQNSIDARRDNSKPVIVEFSLFSADAKQIPGIDRLKEELKSCLNYWSEKETIRTELSNMLQSISKNKIPCLRISDFNTTGLVGVSDSLNSDKPWYLLTKGSGISLKEGSSGGSKGIGKFSTFVASSFNTVFYSTTTEQGEIGYQGIAKYASTNSLSNKEEKTSGNGYYSSNDKNQPILETFNLDKGFTRSTDDYGTDVYILGYEYTDWESQVISKILESFMVAIVRGHLEVIVSKEIINTNTLGKILQKKYHIKNKDLKMINAQYHLLTSENIYYKKIPFSDQGDIELMIKGYNHQEVNNAVNKCLMIRYPYMKIKSFDKLAYIPYSALCIIGDNQLNQTLRRIENPQHTDWEINRVKDKDQKEMVSKLIKDLKNLISDEIKEYLLQSDNQVSDIEGASDYLPEEGEGNPDQGNEIVNTHTSNLKENKTSMKIGQKESEEEIGMEPQIGDPDEEGEGKHYGDEEKNGGIKESPELEGQKEIGENVIFNAAKLESVKYKFFIYNKKEKVYNLTITSPIDEEKCMISIFALDDMNNKRRLNFTEVVSNTENQVIDGNIHFKLCKNEKSSFKFKTDSEERFSAEVILYAIE